MDRLLAEKVMGWKVRKRAVNRNLVEYYWSGKLDGYMGACCLVSAWKPTTDIRDAMTVVEHISKDEKLEFSLVKPKSHKDMWVASFGYFNTECPECGEDPFTVEHQGVGETAEFAVCLAALKAKGIGLNGLEVNSNE